MALKLHVLQYSSCKLPVLAAATVLSAALALPAHAAGALVCVSNAEKEALDIRVLQTEFMVAALSCNQHDEYNRFITTFQPLLKANGTTLKTLFRKTHGSKGPKALNTFVTGLANKASIASMKAWNGYCASVSDLFEEAIATPPQNMRMVASRPWMADRHGYVECAVPKKQEINTASHRG